MSVAIQTAIEALPGPATPNAVFHQLATADPTRTITDVSNDGKCLIWIADNGETQSLSRAALGKRLARLQPR